MSTLNGEVVSSETSWLRIEGFSIIFYKCLLSPSCDTLSHTIKYNYFLQCLSSLFLLKFTANMGTSIRSKSLLLS